MRSDYRRRLLEGLEHRVPDVRERCAYVVSLSADQFCVQDLVHSLRCHEDDILVAVYLIDAIAQAGTTTDVALLYPYAAATRPLAVRLTAIRAIERLGDRELYLKKLAVRDSSRQVRDLAGQICASKEAG